MATITICRWGYGVCTTTPSGGDPIHTSGDLINFRSVFEPGGSYDLEAVAGHINGLTSVEFELDDGVNDPISKTATAETLSVYDPTWYPNRTGCYRVNFTAAELADLDDGEVTLTITATPTSGTAREQTHTFLNNVGGTRSIKTVYANASTGDDGTGDGSSGNPYATLHIACEQAATSAAGDISDPEDVIPRVRCQGTGLRYELAQVGSPYATNLTWLTIEPDTGATPIWTQYGVASGRTHRVLFLRFKGGYFDTANSQGGTGANVIAAGFTASPSHDEDAMWFDGVEITHPEGRAGQASSQSEVLVNESNFGGPICFSGCHIHDMYRDGMATPAYVRDCQIDTIDGDTGNDAQMWREVYAYDNLPHQYRLKLTSTTGAVVGGFIYGTTSGETATIAAVYSGEGVLIADDEGVTFNDFDADESVTDGIEFYTVGETAGVDTPAGSATFAPKHPDFMQYDQPDADRNAVITDCIAYQMDGQIMFIEKTSGNVLVQRLVGYSINSAFISQFGDDGVGTSSTHILWWGCTVPNQRLYARVHANHTFIDCDVRHCIFRDFYGDIPSTDSTVAGITIDECHATNPSATYTSSRGAINLVNGPAYDEYDTIADPDLSPENATGLNLIPTGEAVFAYDAQGQELANDGTDVVGAYQITSEGGGVDPGDETGFGDDSLRRWQIRPSAIRRRMARG